jgi:hypothetical protein
MARTCSSALVLFRSLEPVAEGCRRQQELEQEAEGPEAGHADRQALQAGSAGHAATVRAEGGGKGRLTHELWGRPQLAKPLCESLSRFSIAFQAN